MKIQKLSVLGENFRKKVRKNKYKFSLYTLVFFVILVSLGIKPPWALPVTAVNSQPVLTAEPEPIESCSISPVFTPEVQRWESAICEWAEKFEVDPNLVATLMQIESCGNPWAVSPAGAQGPFQVMSDHFESGENMLDPNTNASRGLSYMVKSLELSQGHVGMAFAGYNGGHSVIETGWTGWAAETRRFYRWGVGIYYDATSGLLDSPTLHDWLAAGGASLCEQATIVLENYP